jgi:hypothetical protein
MLAHYYGLDLWDIRLSSDAHTAKEMEGVGRCGYPLPIHILIPEIRRAGYFYPPILVRAIRVRRYYMYMLTG